MKKTYHKWTRMIYICKLSKKTVNNFGSRIITLFQKPTSINLEVKQPWLVATCPFKHFNVNLHIIDRM